MEENQEILTLRGCAFTFRRIKLGREELLSGQPMWLSTPVNFITLRILYNANQTANYNCFDYSVSKFIQLLT